jgi:hypothetical protein
MGRPLNKKYFGNRNTGSASVTTDDGIGGGAVASVTLNALGSYTTRPTITFAVPTLPNGVRATGTITSEVLSATISGGSGYGNAQTFNLTVANAAGETAVLNVTSNAGGAVVTVNSITTRGTFTALTAVVAVSGGTGTLAVPVLTYRAKEVVITEAGSGYTAAPTPTFTQSVTATSVNMLVDSGVISTTGNQENAIQMVAFLTGGSAGAVDIIKQVSTTRYKVTDGTRTGIVALTATEADEAGEGSILATDADDGTYFVTKLTGRKATLTRGTGTIYETGAAVQWTFGTATATVCKIANA